MKGYTSPPERDRYYTQVWNLVRRIPAGKVATYGQIAALLAPPGGMSARSYLAFGPRWVGGAMARCPDDVPWQRVVNAQGKISLRKGGYEEQRLRLLADGIEFDDRGRINLELYRWEGIEI
jgi:methylated-DNA-protein-cysteine methyltransferase-like protein